MDGGGEFSDCILLLVENVTCIRFLFIVIQINGLFKWIVVFSCDYVAYLECVFIIR